MKIAVVAGGGRTVQEVAAYCASALEEMEHSVEIHLCDFNRGAGYLPGFLRSALRFLLISRFGAKLTGFHPDLVFVIKGEEFDAREIETLREQTGGVWADWWIDDPGLLFISRRLSPAFDLFLTSDPASIEVHRQVGARKVEHLTFAYDPSIHQPSQDTKRWDVVFAGRLTPRRAEWLTPLIPLGLALWTDPRLGWVSLDQRILSQDLPATHPLRKAWRGDFVWGRDLARLYGEAKICINIHSQQGTATNMRVFEATACGTLLITDDRPLLHELFIVGGDNAEIVVFSSPEELKEKVQYYLEHEDERKAIAARGLARCRRDHTYALRMKRVLELL